MKLETTLFKTMNKDSLDEEETKEVYIKHS